MSEARIQMFCPGKNAQGYPGYNAHPGGPPYIIAVPFREAIHNPPQCDTHKRPYLTIGGYRLAKLEEAFRESGNVVGECDVRGPGTGQSAYCHPHGWAGAVQDCDHYNCPHQRLAAWIVRRHEHAREQVV